jgi:hypothetical protein
MANRYWKLSENMGYVGTDSYETIDLCDWWGISEDEVDALDQNDVENRLSSDAWEQAVEKVDAWAEPISKEDME